MLPWKTTVMVSKECDGAPWDMVVLPREGVDAAEGARWCSPRRTVVLPKEHDGAPMEDDGGGGATEGRRRSYVRHVTMLPKARGRCYHRRVAVLFVSPLMSPVKSISI